MCSAYIPCTFTISVAKDTQCSASFHDLQLCVLEKRVVHVTVESKADTQKVA